MLSRLRPLIVVQWRKLRKSGVLDHHIVHGFTLEFELLNDITLSFFERVEFCFDKWFPLIISRNTWQLRQGVRLLFNTQHR